MIKNTHIVDGAEVPEMVKLTLEKNALLAAEKEEAAEERKKKSCRTAIGFEEEDVELRERIRQPPTKIDRTSPES